MSKSPQPLTNQLTGIFINYRRGDSASDAGRLEADLEKYFPKRVFRDIHDIEPGRDFVEVINEEVGKCGAVLVLIGRQWLTLKDKNGNRRLDNPNDFVVAEIAAALKRDNVRVIPVLLQGAEMPEAEQLPESLKSLVRRHARKISDEYWNEDVTKLVAVLEKVCGRSPEPTADGASGESGDTADAVPGKRGAWSKANIARAVVLAVMASLVILYSFSGGSNPPPPATYPTPAPTAAAQTPVTSAVVNLADNTAEFFFPFDTTGAGWKWNLNTSKAGDYEYYWEVNLPDDYLLSVFVQKGAGGSQVTGDFKSLLAAATKGMYRLRPDGKYYQVLNEGGRKFVDVAVTAEAHGLRMKVTGDGVRRILAGSRPAELSFKAKTPGEGQLLWTIPVQYR